MGKRAQIKGSEALMDCYGGRKAESLEDMRSGSVHYSNHIAVIYNLLVTEISEVD
jgi:hypothetical protein